MGISNAVKRERERGRKEGEEGKEDVVDQSRICADPGVCVEREAACR